MATKKIRVKSHIKDVIPGRGKKMKRIKGYTRKKAKKRR